MAAYAKMKDSKLVSIYIERQMYEQFKELSVKLKIPYAELMRRQLAKGFLSYGDQDVDAEEESSPEDMLREVMRKERELKSSVKKLQRTLDELNLSEPDNEFL